MSKYTGKSTCTFDLAVVSLSVIGAPWQIALYKLEYMCIERKFSVDSWCSNHCNSVTRTLSLYKGSILVISNFQTLSVAFLINICTFCLVVELIY